MRLSTKGRYAARIMVYLAMHDSGRPARKQDIAEAEEITADYVEQILMRLKTVGLVKSFRGARGGFSIACDPALTTIADVVEATDGPIAVAPCINGSCERVGRCATRSVWQATNDAIRSTLLTTTIADLVAQAQELNASAQPDFSI